MSALTASPPEPAIASTPRRRGALNPLGVLPMTVGLVAEFLAWLALFRVAGFYGGALFALLHIVASALLALAAWWLAPQLIRGTRTSTLAYFFSGCLFTSWLGIVGTLLVLLPALHRFGPRREAVWEERRKPELPFKPVQVNPDGLFMRVGLSTIVKYFRNDQDLRRRAVMATRHLGGRRAVPILREALGDPADEVRLLAYSMLSGKERVFEIEIRRLQAERARRIENGSERAIDWIDEQIAALHWEQAALGLVEGEVQAFVVQEALRHIDAALAVRETPGRHFLRGRICLRLGRLAEADHALGEARRLGLDDNRVAPYRAELAFRRHDYAEVRAELARLGTEMRKLPLLDPLVRYWSPR